MALDEFTAVIDEDRVFSSAIQSTGLILDDGSRRTPFTPVKISKDTGQFSRFPKTDQATVGNSHSSESIANETDRYDHLQRLIDTEHSYFTWLHQRIQVARVTTSVVSKPFLDAELTEALAIDCEGVGIGPKSRVNIAARVSIVNERCEVVYDTYVKPSHPVVDYRTWITGIRREDLENGKDLKDVVNDVKQIVEGRKLVGHALHNDFKMLRYEHPTYLTRDTSTFDLFVSMSEQCHPSLKTLARLFLNLKIQDGIHDPVVDACTAMKLYLKHKKLWEESEYGWPELPPKKPNKW